MVEALKAQVTEADSVVQATRVEAKRLKAAYEAAVARQLQLQRDLNKLLEHKSTWSDDDVARLWVFVVSLSHLLQVNLACTAESIGGVA